MKLLVIAEDVPNKDPIYGDGSSLISFHVLLGLAKRADVRLATFDGVVDVPNDILRVCSSVAVYPLRSRSRATVGAPLTGQSVAGYQRGGSNNRRAIRQLSQAADVTLVHGPQALSFSADVSSPLAIQVVDPWSMRVEMEAEMATGARGTYLRARALQFRRAERRLPAKARLLTVGKENAHAWSRSLNRRVRAIPNGVEPPVSSVATRRHLPPTVCFTGSLNYGPNIDSVERLVRNIAPRIWAKIPACRFVIAGRQPGPPVRVLASERVEIHADVPSMADVFQAAHVAVFADRYGLGIRNSVAEAVAFGLPVVATSTAAREMPPSAMLSTSDDDAELADLAIRALEQTAQPSPALKITPLRTWDVVVEEYLEELRAAIAGDPVSEHH